MKLKMKRRTKYVREYPKQKREKWLLCIKYCIFILHNGGRRTPLHIMSPFCLLSITEPKLHNILTKDIMTEEMRKDLLHVRKIGSDLYSTRLRRKIHKKKKRKGYPYESFTLYFGCAIIVTPHISVRFYSKKQCKLTY